MKVREMSGKIDRKVRERSGKGRIEVMVLALIVVLLPSVSFASWEVKFGGYGQVQYEFHPAKGSYDQLKVRRARFKADGKLADENLFYRVYIDLEKGNAVRPREAYIGYSFEEPIKLKITLGQQLVPFSFDHLLSSSKRLVAERSAVTSNLAPGRDIGGLQDREIGITLAGEKFVKFWLGVFQGGTEIKDGEYLYIVTEKMEERKDFALRILIPIPGLEGFDIGGSAFWGGLAEENGRKILPHNRFGGEIIYFPKERGLSFQLEGMYGEDPFESHKSPKPVTDGTGKVITREKMGGYGQIGYKLKEGILKGFEPAVRVGYFDYDTKAKDDEVVELSVGLNQWIGHSRILLDYTIPSVKDFKFLKTEVITLRYQISF